MENYLKISEIRGRTLDRLNGYIRSRGWEPKLGSVPVSEYKRAVKIYRPLYKIVALDPKLKPPGGVMMADDEDGSVYSINDEEDPYNGQRFMKLYYPQHDIEFMCLENKVVCKGDAKMVEMILGSDFPFEMDPR